MLTEMLLYSIVIAVVAYVLPFVIGIRTGLNQGYQVSELERGGKKKLSIALLVLVILSCGVMAQLMKGLVGVGANILSLAILFVLFGVFGFSLGLLWSTRKRRQSPTT